MFWPSANPTAAAVSVTAVVVRAAAPRPCQSRALRRSRCTPGRAASPRPASRSGASTLRAAARAPRGSPSRRRLLRSLDGDRRVLGDRDEHVDLVAARLAAGDRLVDRQDPEQPARRCRASARRARRRGATHSGRRSPEGSACKRCRSTRPSRTRRRARGRRRAAGSAGRAAAPSPRPGAPGRAAPRARRRCRRRC